jgi:hypothetical protein
MLKDLPEGYRSLAEVVRTFEVDRQSDNVTVRIEIVRELRGPLGARFAWLRTDGTWASFAPTSSGHLEASTEDEVLERALGELHRWGPPTSEDEKTSPEAILAKLQRIAEGMKRGPKESG